jgi:hypothetical protein
MAIKAKRDTQKSFDPAPEGVHRAVIVDMYLKEAVPTAFGPKDKIYIVHEIDEENDDGDRFCVWSTYNFSLHENSSLMSAYGAEIEDMFDELEDDDEEIDLEELLGWSGQIKVVHNADTKDPNKTWANVEAIMPLGKRMKPLKPSGKFVRHEDKQTSAPDPSKLDY